MCQKHPKSITLLLHSVDVPFGNTHPDLLPFRTPRRTLSASGRSISTCDGTCGKRPWPNSSGRLRWQPYRGVRGVRGWVAPGVCDQQAARGGGEEVDS